MLKYSKHLLNTLACGAYLIQLAKVDTEIRKVTHFNGNSLKNAYRQTLYGAVNRVNVNEVEVEYLETFDVNIVGPEDDQALESCGGAWSRTVFIKQVDAYIIVVIKIAIKPSYPDDAMPQIAFNVV